MNLVFLFEGQLLVAHSHVSCSDPASYRRPNLSILLSYAFGIWIKTRISALSRYFLIGLWKHICRGVFFELYFWLLTRRLNRSSCTSGFGILATIFNPAQSSAKLIFLAIFELLVYDIRRLNSVAFRKCCIRLNFYIHKKNLFFGYKPASWHFCRPALKPRHPWQSSGDAPQQNYPSLSFLSILQNLEFFVIGR